MKMWMPGRLAFATLCRAASMSACLRPRQAQHHRRADRVGDAGDGLGIAERGGGEAGLDHIDAELLQLARDDDLLLHVHRRAGRLLAVAQRRVEDLYSFDGHRCPLVTLSWSWGSDRSRSACWSNKKGHGRPARGPQSAVVNWPRAVPQPVAPSSSRVSDSLAHRARGVVVAPALEFRGVRTDEHGAATLEAALRRCQGAVCRARRSSRRIEIHTHRAGPESA